jgi:hypothetical protein
VSRPDNITQISAFSCYNTSGLEPTVPVDGSMLFAIDQLGYPQSESFGYDTISVDLSSIPTLKFSTRNGGENVLAFLLCSPHVSIQTRQVSATGNGNLTLGKH